MRCLALDKDDEDLEGEQNLMNTPRVALHVASDPQVGSDPKKSAGGEALDRRHDPDPLRRLEAELQRVGGEQPVSERLHDQAWTLLEEAWGLLTECLVLRDGLLDACHEIEQTMEGIQQRLGGLPAAPQLGAEDRSIAAGHEVSTAEHGESAAELRTDSGSAQPALPQ